MNCTRVLLAFASHPQQSVMPVDLAMCVSLSQRQPLYQLLSVSHLEHTQSAPGRRSPLHSTSSRPCSPSSPALPQSPGPSELRSCLRKEGDHKSKKCVAFADAKGFALTDVHHFVPEPSSPVPPLPLSPLPAKMRGLELTSKKVQQRKFQLGFPQPGQDVNGFLARLKEKHVQLESCDVSEQSLSGKVCVSHISIEKTVHVRVTFDSWRSHHDIPCRFIQQQRGRGPDMDVFAFDVSLPKNIDPMERIEFCFSLRTGPGATPHLDDNRGQNYRVCMEKEESTAIQGDAIANRFYPTLSKHRSPSWPPRVSLLVPNSADPPNLQRGSPTRVRADWNTVFN